MNELKRISNSFEQTIKDSDLQNVTIDLAETFVDSVLEDGILKDFPVINIITGVTKAVLGIRERLLIKKLIYFLIGIKDIDPIKRQELVDKINNSQKYKIKIGEKLLYIIDGCEDHISSQYISDLFNAFLKEEITYNEFLRASFIVRKLITQDIETFIETDIHILETSISEYDDRLSDFQNSMITAGILTTETDRINIRDQEDYKMNEKYVVEGGDMLVYLTDIGSIMKRILKKGH